MSSDRPDPEPDHRPGAAGAELNRDETRPEGESAPACPSRSQRAKQLLFERRSGGKHRRRPPQRLLPLLAVLLVLAGITSLLRGDDSEPVAEVTLSEALDHVDDGHVDTAELNDDARTLLLSLEEAVEVDDVTTTQLVAGYPLFYGGDLVERLEDAGVPVEITRDPPPSTITSLLFSLTPLVLIIGAMFFLVRRFAGGNLRTSESRKGPVEVPSTRFSDVAGATEAIEDLAEIVEYLRNPESFHRAGARSPKGVLLVGPPGTGKTLLARACAGEAGVPFFALSGSDFVEMYVGVGASRVRQLFEKAKKAERAIIFIDELDAVGKARSGNAVGGTEERENTLNQLLVELDGFAQTNIVVVGATNRPEILDPALTRAGRFDRTVTVDAPDRKGRKQLFELYLRSAVLAPGVDIEATADSLSKRTAGMTGADVNAVVNEAALIARREGHGGILPVNLEDALERVVMGRERRSREITELGRRITAWHEAGHVVCALMQDDAADPARVSIIPRGGAGGVTWRGHSDEAFVTRSQCLATLVELLGGRAAEEIILDGDFTQGAASDIAAATAQARRMVCDWGMSSLGISRIDQERLVGDEAVAVREEVERLLGDALDAARALCAEHRDLLDAVAESLLEHETLSNAQLVDLRASILAGRGPGT